MTPEALATKAATLPELARYAARKAGARAKDVLQDVAAHILAMPQRALDRELTRRAEAAFIRALVIRYSHDRQRLATVLLEDCGGCAAALASDANSDFPDAAWAELDAFDAAFSRLHVNEQAVLVAVSQGYTVKKFASEVGLNEQTAAKLHHRGRQKLKNHYSKYHAQTT